MENAVIRGIGQNAATEMAPKATAVWFAKFVQHPDLSITITASWMHLDFDDREISPAQIRAALLQHLPPEKEIT